MRATLQDLAWNPHVGLTRIVARVLAPSARIERDAARLDRLTGMTRFIPVRRPFPDVADHVVETVAVRVVRTDGRRALIAVARHVAPRKFTLPGVRHVPIVREKLVTPRVV